jgi:hypothetical protein
MKFNDRPSSSLEWIHTRGPIESSARSHPIMLGDLTMGASFCEHHQVGHVLDQGLEHAIGIRRCTCQDGYLHYVDR